MNDSIRNHCIYNAKLNGNEFVGFKYENNNLTIYFPLGYSKPNDDESCRRDIQNLIYVLSNFSEQEKSFYPSNLSNENNQGFPFSSYLYLIKDFMLNGYYRENEIEFKHAASGKINWNRTIKTVNPYIINSKLIYSNFIVNSKNYKFNQIITKIHEYLVYESFQKIGFIFTEFIPQKPVICFDTNMCISIIRTKMSQTCNEASLLRFKCMLDILLFLNSSRDDNFTFGTEDFEYIWQNLIDYTFGINNKSDYYPHTYWNINDKKIDEDLSVKKAALQPDTIMITKIGNSNNYFVLDSKYYKYGITSKPSHLPGTDSIVKQIAYAEYIEETKRIKEEKIYNAFIMPFDCLIQKDKTIKIQGYAVSDHNNNKQYSKIFGVFLDIKTIMYNYEPKNPNLIKELSDIITQYNIKLKLKAEEN